MQEIDNSCSRYKDIKVNRYGSSVYFISSDGKYFVKEDKNRKELMETEYRNTLMLNENVQIQDLSFLEPICFSADEGTIVTKYVNAPVMIEVLEPELYFKFGRALKDLHEKGYSHSHLEFDDIIVSGEGFIMTDLGYVNVSEPIRDLVSLRLSIGLNKVRRPWQFFLCKTCYASFLKGYGTEYLNDVYSGYRVFAEKYIKRHMENKRLSARLKGLVLNILYRLGYL